MWQEQRLGIKSEPEPEIDDLTADILTAFSLINRGRKFSEINGQLMPLSISDVKQYAETYGIGIKLDVFSDIIFALDDEFIESNQTKTESALIGSNEDDEG